MKPNLHPEYKKLTVTLGDGTTMETYSTMKASTFAPDIDATNHPFYTGKRQFLDTAGRVEKFMRRYNRPMPTTEDAADAPAAEAKG